ncbi:YiiX/YebB-like N1pC/P60 family cysteine hydrolase [Alicyclobacillus macrosporangiidus]|uniref:YiiX/YebB-like N1pC/P60 family cysteine hydrolase n=1 Tax=Alicyclobacillus macrosporangiidus TaxID=392015 RepID=UPI000943B716|nr:YiiX/YebB-like N1pC/P60 family cysteine hydrolase [Alicyclobacillus macrosporangiidus]
MARKGWAASKWWVDAAGLLAGAVCFTALAVCPDGWTAHAHTLSLLHHMSREMAHGRFTGVLSGGDNGISEAALEPGDVLFCHNPGGAYGYWTHVVIYAGGGQCVDAFDFVHGTVLRPLASYRPYHAVAAFRARQSPEWRRQLAQAALAEAGRPYDPFGALTDRRSEYCSKLVWRLFHDRGVQLCPASPWVLPDDLVASPAWTNVGTWRVPS